MFANVLIANRGEIACRIIRTARRLGMQDDRDAHAGRPRRAVHPARRRGARDRRGRERLSRRRRRSSRWRGSVGAECLHPGYGFLSENADFADACARGRHRLRRAAARGDARHGAQELRQGADAEGRRAGRAGLSRRQPEPEVPAREGLRDRLSGPDQGDRRRAAGAACAGSTRIWISRRRSRARAARRRPRSATAGC